MVALERSRRWLGRPGLLRAAQVVASLLVLLVSLTGLPHLLPLLTEVAFPKDLMAAGVDARTGVAYAAVVLHVVTATLVVAALEAWRRRLHRHRRFRTHTERLLTLGLALPLYVLVSVELLLLPIGHGVLYLPRYHEYSRAVVTFRTSVPEAELKGRSLLLLELRPGPRHTFYCPYGSRTWEVDQRDVEEVVGRTTKPLTRLLGAFQELSQCDIGSRAPEEVAR